MQSDFNVEAEMAKNIKQALSRVALALAPGDVRDIGLAHADLLCRLLLRQRATSDLAVDRMKMVNPAA